MTELNGYAVFLFPQALESLGDAIKPYLHDGPGGQHVLCNEIDTAGSLVEMAMRAQTQDGHEVELELMVPTNMIRMIVSARSDTSFGFGPRVAPALMSTLPPVAGDAPPPDAPAEAVPKATGESTGTETPPKP